MGRLDSRPGRGCFRALKGPNRLPLAGLLIVILSAAACYPVTPAPVAPVPTVALPTVAPATIAPAATLAPASPPLSAVLGNLVYSGVLDAPIRLVDGVAEYQDGSSGKPTVRLMPEYTAAGDLNGDGVEDAVVVLRNETSGTGRFVYLAAVLDALGSPTVTDALMIGDRVIVKSLAVRDGKVDAALVVQGPNDGLCCPTLDAARVYVLQDGKLVERE